MVLLSQALCYLANPSIDTHDKQVLKKELANELVSCNHMTLTQSQYVWLVRWPLIF